MSELTQYADIANINTRKAFGWKGSDKKFVIGEREISIAETSYAPPSSQMMPYAPAMTWEGTTEDWLAELPDNPYVHAGVAVAVAAALMRFIDDKPWVINFYGHPDWASLLNIIASVFGHPERMIVDNFQDALPVFNNFPILVKDLAFENPRLVKELLFVSNKFKSVISFSAISLSVTHKRILNIPLHDFPPVLIAPKNYGVFIETFLKEYLRKHKFNVIPSTESFDQDLLNACKLTPFNCLVIKEAFLLKHSKEGMIMDFINDNLDKVYVVAGARIAKALRLKEPDAPIYIRYEIETKMLYIVRAEFRKYHDIRDLDEPLKVYWDSGALVEIKKKSMYGGGVVSARQYTHVMCIDTTKLIGFNAQEFLYGVGLWARC